MVDTTPHPNCAGAQASVYTEPRSISSIDDCYFYHTMDIPGYGTIQGEWDLRGSLSEYLGGYDFSGKRTLDIGAASGILGFHAERQGADVVAFDLSEEFDWDIVPFADKDNASLKESRRNHIDRINNGFWFCHNAYGSQARMVNGVVYDIPNFVGPVDVAIFGSILLHLRDPFLALENAARLATEAIIVTDRSPYNRFVSKFRKSPRFMPSSEEPDKINDGWFRLPPLLTQEYLNILGFKKQNLTWSKFKYRSEEIELYTIVAKK